MGGLGFLRSKNPNRGLYPKKKQSGGKNFQILFFDIILAFRIGWMITLFIMYINSLLP